MIEALKEVALVQWCGEGPPDLRDNEKKYKCEQDQIDICLQLPMVTVTKIGLDGRSMSVGSDISAMALRMCPSSAWASLNHGYIDTGGGPESSAISTLLTSTTLSRLPSLSLKLGGRLNCEARGVMSPDGVAFRAG